MILSLMSFEQHFNCFWSYILTFQYYGLSVEFPWFPSFRFWVGLKTKTWKSQKIFFSFFFWSYIKRFLCINFFVLEWYTMELLCLTAFSVISVVSVIPEFLTWSPQSQCRQFRQCCIWKQYLHCNCVSTSDLQNRAEALSLTKVFASAPTV